MKEKIFVLVKVTYDYYRFQENLLASTDIEKLKTAASHFKDYELKEYSSDSVKQRNLDKKELCHYWIQEFK